ncbi:MAG: protein phosphatase 2C domain-containing protein [Candidatus Thermoplasmatota archaeon]|nr:protein phosphatase 2C domain-containing protein [Candidatus Thermoplasmatota archaeon]
MQYYYSSEKGIHHIINEDYLFEKVTDDFAVFAVADGVGGLAHGDIASKFAVKPFTRLSIPPPFLEPLFQEANKCILSESEKQKCMMASTLVGAVLDIKANKVTIAHVGDSRAYLFSNDGIWHTKDDTLVQELVDMGIVNEHQAFDHPDKNRLNKALGVCEKITVQTYTTTITGPFTLLLCSDGLHDYVRDEDIKSILMRKRPKLAIEHLVRKARDNGSTDDITIIIMKN